MHKGKWNEHLAINTKTWGRTGFDRRIIYNSSESCLLIWGTRKRTGLNILNAKNNKLAFAA